MTSHDNIDIKVVARLDGRVQIDLGRHATVSMSPDDATQLIADLEKAVQMVRDAGPR